jgi:F-box/WD-40 domain protein MET30
MATLSAASDPHTALLQGHDHEGPSGRTRYDQSNSAQHDEAFVSKSASKQLEKMITPYLAHHIPNQYNPLGAPFQNAQPVGANSKYCYRHRPDLLCRRQADEPTMEQLQAVC